jgi:hypothetical protein
MSTMNLPGSKVQHSGKAHNLTAICEPIVSEMWEPRQLNLMDLHDMLQRELYYFYQVLTTKQNKLSYNYV